MSRSLFYAALFVMLTQLAYGRLSMFKMFQSSKLKRRFLADAKVAVSEFWRIATDFPRNPLAI